MIDFNIQKENEKLLARKLEGKNVLYVATKNSDYIRLQQEIKLIQKHAAKSTVIASNHKSYIKRIFYVYKKLATLSAREYEVIFVGFMAQMIIPFWKWKFRKSILIVDFFISIFDTLIDDRKKFKTNSIFGKISHWLDQLTIKTADWIICDTKAHGRYFSNEFNAINEKQIVLYLEADQKYYHPMKIDKPKKWRDKFLVLYFGSILPVQGVDVVMRAIELLEGETNIVFLVIGPIGNKIKKAMTKNVEYIDWLPQETLAEYIAFSDLCRAGHFSDTVGKARRTIPGKAYIYQAMGKKMILGDSEANHELFSERSDYHEYIPLGDSNALAQCIVKYGNKMYEGMKFETKK